MALPGKMLLTTTWKIPLLPPPSGKNPSDAHEHGHCISVRKLRFLFIVRLPVFCTFVPNLFVSVAMVAESWYRGEEEECRRVDQQ